MPEPPEIDSKVKVVHPLLWEGETCPKFFQPLRDQNPDEQLQENRNIYVFVVLLCQF